MNKIIATILLLFFSNIALAKGPGDVLVIGQAAYNHYNMCHDDAELRDFFKMNDIERGDSVRITKEKAEEIMESKKYHVQKYAGGGAANTAAGIVTLGGKVLFVGAVARDKVGASFEEDMSSLGVETQDIVIKTPNAKTGVVFTCVTPDAERTIAIYPGVSHNITTENVTFVENAIRDYKVLFSEADMWDGAESMEAIKSLFASAKRLGVTTAFGLSSTERIKEYKPELLEFIREVDILFANEEEAKEMFSASNIRDIYKNASDNVNTFFITRGKDGVSIINENGITDISANVVADIVDTAGAGDMFASGVLYGYTKGMDIEESAEIGIGLAEKIIMHIGSKPLLHVDYLTARP